MLLPPIPRYRNPYQKIRVLRKVVGVIILFDLCGTILIFPLYLTYSILFFNIQFKSVTLIKDIFDEKKVIIASRNL
jgi:hypothetical protein